MYKRRKILMVVVIPILFSLFLSSSAISPILASNNGVVSSSDANSQLTVDRNGVQAFDIAVTPVGYDDMGSILTGLGYSWDLIQLDDLANSTLLSEYDAVFINCDDYTDDYTYANETLRSYVQNGGNLYVSDWAFSIIEATFPDKLEFIYETNASYTYDDSRIGETGIVTADIISTGMSSYFGVSTVDIDFDLGGWVVLDSVASDVDVLLAGNVSYYNTTWDLVYSYEPITVEYTAGDGAVIYTSFHFEGQEAAIATELMEYLVFKVLTEGCAQRLIDNIEALGYDIVADIRGSVNQSQSVSFDIELDPTNVIFAICWPNEAASLKMTVIPPGGSPLNVTGTKPVNITIEDATTGNYEISITGVSNVQINDPFVIIIGNTEEAVPEFNAYFMFLATIIIFLTGIIVITRKAKFSKFS